MLLEFANSPTEDFAKIELGETLKNLGFRCHLDVSEEDDGTFSVVVLNLPGTGSCGDSEEEAIANTKEAVAGVIRSYREDSEDVPWIDTTAYAIPNDTNQKWILVDA